MEIKSDCFTGRASVEAGIKGALEKHQETINEWKIKLNDMEKIDKIDNYIKCLQQIKEGKTLEINWQYNGWQKCKDINDLFDALREGLEMRIVKEPPYRPYANAEEFLKASREHGPYMSGVIPIKYNVKGVVLYDDLLGDNFDFKTWKEIFDLGLKWQDKTPCGILEHND